MEWVVYVGSFIAGVTIGRLWLMVIDPGWSILPRRTRPSYQPRGTGNSAGVCKPPAPAGPRAGK